jgi:hypothetical protein
LFFFSPVSLGAADPAVFVGARASGGTGKLLARESALRLGELRGAALVEKAPYTTAQIAYLGALATLLVHDVFTAAPEALSYAIPDGVHKHPSAVAEYAILALSLAAQLEQQGAHTELVSLLQAAGDLARRALVPSIWSARLRMHACFAHGATEWDGSLDVARVAYTLASTPPKTDALRMLAAGRLRDLHHQLKNQKCADEATALEHTVASALLRRLEVTKDASLVPVVVRLHFFLGEADTAREVLAREASNTPGLLPLAQESSDMTTQLVRQHLCDSVGGADETWPPPTVTALSMALPIPSPSVTRFTDAEDMGLPSIPRALELRSYAAEERDSAAVAAIDAWLTAQGYTLKRDSARALLVASGLLVHAPTPLQRIVDLASAIKQRLTPAPVVWPPPNGNVDAWSPRPTTEDEWRTLLPKETQERHKQLRALGQTRGAWLRLGVPADLLPPPKKKVAPAPVQMTITKPGLKDFLS